MMKNNPEAAFSLVELLVVTAIIGILASIGIAGFSEYRKRSFTTAVITDFRSMLSLQEAYFVDTFEYYPCDDTGTNSSAPGCETLLDFRYTADVCGSHPSSEDHIGLLMRHNRLDNQEAELVDGQPTAVDSAVGYNSCA